MIPQDTFTALAIPVPPEPLLEQALGYTGQARYLATWWEPCGDEAMYSDGRITATGEWTGFLAFVQHPAVYPSLFTFDLGSSESPAQIWLVIDRQERKAWIAQPGVARAFLEQQWPRSTLVLDFDDMDQLLEHLIGQFRQVQPPNLQEVMKHMEQHRTAVAAMQQWLTQYHP